MDDRRLVAHHRKLPGGRLTTRQRRENKMRFWYALAGNIGLVSLYYGLMMMFGGMGALF